MRLVEAKDIPRKWEWIAKQLKEHKGSEEAIKIAEQIDEHMKTIYGEHTHTSMWVDDMYQRQTDSRMHTIIGLATKWPNCTACIASLRADGRKNCSKCEFGKIDQPCLLSELEDPAPLFRQFIDEIVKIRK